jgi:hypothetical protein
MFIPSLRSRLVLSSFALIALFVGLVAAGDCFAGSQTGEGSSSLLYVKDRDALVRKFAKMVSLRQNEAVLRRACEFQRQQRSPPVSCFALSKSSAETEELTDECLRLAPRAIVLPIVDDTVGATCRGAIEARRLDLKYVRF